MEPEAPAPRLVTRDRAVTLGALALVVALSWTYLLRAPRHAPEMAAPARPMTEEAHASPAGPESDIAEEDDVPRFP